MQETTDRRFARRVKSGRPLFVAYFTYGFPDPARSLELMTALLEVPVDVLEVGYPFSDPVADGPTIQRAVTQALRHGLSLEQCLSEVQRLRTAYPETPLYLMSYLNPLWRRGLDRAAAAASEAGLDGWIVPDLPFQMAAPVRAVLQAHGLGLVHLVSNNLSDERIAEIARASDDFVYAISTLGVTGAREALDPELDAYLSRLQQLSPRPFLVGFGISRPQHVRSLAGKCHGFIVGSALIQAALERPEQPLEAVVATARNLRAALDSLPEWHFPSWGAS